MIRTQGMFVVLPLLATALLLVPGLAAAPKHPGVVKHKADTHKQQAAAAHSTASHAVKSHRRMSHTRKTSMPVGPSSDRIEQIQQALARSGYYSLEPTGKWDQDTANALERFQQAQGISSTGKLDASSLQMLGLGSDIAGVSPPRPLVPADTTGMNAKDSAKGTGIF